MRERRDMISRQSQRPEPQQPYVPAHYYPQQQAPALPPELPEPSLIKPILRQWWIVAVFALVGFGVAIAYIKHAQPLYTSTAKIYLPPVSGSVAEALGGIERSNYLSTQVEVIKSTTVLDIAASNASLKGLKTFDRFRGNAVIAMRDLLDVDLERKTDLIAVSMDSPYPDEAATIVNAVVTAYTEYCQQEKDLRSNKLLATLQDKNKEETDGIRELENAISDYRIKHPNVSLNETSPLAVQTLQMFSQELSKAQLNLLDLQSSYPPGNPVVQKAVNKVKALQGNYDEALEQATRVNEQTAELQRYKSELERRKEFGKQLSERLHQLEMSMGGRKLIEVDVVEPARIAEFPSSPRKNRLMAVALVCGALLGAGLALLRDRLDGRLRSVEEIQTVIGLPILGVVPAMTGRRTAVARAMTVHLDPRSVVAEAYRTIRTALYFGTTGTRCKTVLLTSPESGDGKTTSASNLAIAIAQTGRTVLLLDADFRKPTQHKNLDIKDAVGLSSVLVGQETLERAIQHTGVEGLDILPCGPIPANPSEILNSREFAELIDTLSERYDHILFDSPPVNAVTDGRILGAICDATIVVLRADKSTRKSGEHARNSLLAVGARVLGAIVNDAPKRRGYDVYGGHYYGAPDTGYAGVVPSTRRLTAAVPLDNAEEDEPRGGNGDSDEPQESTAASRR